MGLSISQLISAATPADFQAKILSVGATLSLATTSWQPGGVTRTIIAILSQILGVSAGTAQSPQLASSGVDGLIATIASGGFLDFASNVSPDPSIANADGTFPPAGNSWLWILADSVYNVQGAGPTQATGPVVLTNSSGSSYGPFLPGTYHLVNPSTKQTYSNTASLTIAAGPGVDTTANFAADVAGAAGTSVANVLTPVTSLIGVTVKTAGGANTNTLTGTNATSNATLVAACRLKLQALGPKLGPGGAYKYFALGVSLGGGYAGTALSADISRVAVVTNIFTGVVNVYLANASGCSVGFLPSGDVTNVNAFLQSVCVPDGVTAVVQRAVEADVAVTLTVEVPNANTGTAAADVGAAVTAYINSLPIGGAPTSGSSLGVPLDALIAAIFKAVSYVQNIEAAQLNGAAADVVLSSSQCAMAVPSPVISVTGTG